eukprot:CFRG3895T1
MNEPASHHDQGIVNSTEQGAPSCNQINPVVDKKKSLLTDTTATNAICTHEPRKSLPNGGRILRDKSKKKAKKVRELNVELNFDDYKPQEQYPRRFLGPEAQQHELDNAYFEGTDPEAALNLALSFLNGKKAMTMGGQEYQALAYACSLQLRLERPEDALATLQKSGLKLRQLDHFLLTTLAQCHEVLNQTDHRITTMQHLTCIEKANSRSWEALGNAYIAHAIFNRNSPSCIHYRHAEVCLQHAQRLLNVELVTAHGFAVQRIHVSLERICHTQQQHGLTIYTKPSSSGEVLTQTENGTASERGREDNSWYKQDNLGQILDGKEFESVYLKTVVKNSGDEEQ